MLTDFDECHSTPCQNGGTCEDQVNGFICLCDDGYEGSQCEHNPDDCNPNPCLNGGTCTDDVNCSSFVYVYIKHPQYEGRDIHDVSFLITFICNIK